MSMNAGALRPIARTRGSGLGTVLLTAAAVGVWGVALRPRSAREDLTRPAGPSVSATTLPLTPAEARLRLPVATAESPPERTAVHRLSWRRVLSMVTSVLVIAFLAFWLVALRPITLGGTANYTVIHGNSMWPLYHDGDLIITHQQSAYSAGDVVAYRVPQGEVGAGDVVIHRITGGDTTSGLVLQGDNNPHADPWHPRLANIVGSTWVQVGRGGRVLVLLHQPMALAILVTVPTVAWILMRKPRKPAATPPASATSAATA